MKAAVTMWEETVIIPTYPIGQPEKNPMFLEKRIYQGSSGAVYPHPVVEKISIEKIDQAYRAVFLENEYIRVMILPQLGGRIQMAYDKVKQRHFIYYNQVIKPALVGLTGPWISGGIEFNWPQHHRPSTFEPVDFTLQTNDDGSKSVWINEVERMTRTKGMSRFTLYPGKSYIEIEGRLYNRTPFPQTFLWWANPAVKVNDHYQSIFPTDVYAVFDHGKRDVSSFPIAKGTYYKVDYAPGTDISRYKNIPVPTSYMAIASKYDFIGGYEHDTGGGLLHIADHHISPGKKQWTWGNGEFGQAWDRNLSDDDGPYIELMTGMFTDNQPDFSWLQPYEEKSFTQYFMPYREVAQVCNATKDAVLGVEFLDDAVHIKLYTTSRFERLNIMIIAQAVELFSIDTDCDPTKPYLQVVQMDHPIKDTDISVTVTDTVTGDLLVAYQKEDRTDPAIPNPAAAAQAPGAIEDNEQLFLTGLHLEQYRHATFNPTDYYLEALRRDPKDARSNNAMGLWLLRRGQFKKAEPFFRNAIATLTQRNPNPYDGEPLYNLGTCLMCLGENEKAFEMFYKATWNDSFQHAGFMNLARISTEQNKLNAALSFIEKSILRNQHSHSARHLKAIILRKQGKMETALTFIGDSLVIDPFNYGCLFEKFLVLKALGAEEEALAAKAELESKSRNWVHNIIEYALDYSHCGCFSEASEMLQQYIDATIKVYPMVYYYLAYFSGKANNDAAVNQHLANAASASPDYCFPNRIEDVMVLRFATVTKNDAKAYYYLGNFWYDKRQYTEAIECWEASAQIDDGFPTVFRNLSLAYYNKLSDTTRSLAAMEKAFELNKKDARVLMELDQLYKRINKPYRERLSLLEKYLALTVSREDLYLERIALYNYLGQYETAMILLGTYKFHPWEGGEGKVVSQYLWCHIELAKKALKKSAPLDAIAHLTKAETYPVNLGEGKLPGTQENDIHYWKGIAYSMLADSSQAKEHFEKATKGNSSPSQAVFYNDAQPDKILYQALSWKELGNIEASDQICQQLIDFGEQHLNDKMSIDYFAVSLPDLLVFDADLDLKNYIHCLYMKGLGWLGLGTNHGQQAAALFKQVLALDLNHMGATSHLEMVSK